jgi:hypothetical protein
LNKADIKILTVNCSLQFQLSIKDRVPAAPLVPLPQTLAEQVTKMADSVKALLGSLLLVVVIGDLGSCKSFLSFSRNIVDGWKAK